ncbi:MAG: chemotaxis MotB protein [Pseudobdellovibrio sp.]|nr:chemotaxis MotB protein [Pseudobdellovibrio sp.]
MAKRQTIVIKKVYVTKGGHHGGSWKVALADFMTAMMAFFLVMWLIGQSEESKKAVSDYFSTPSVIEYNFQNFGAEITLEKLFLDLINEPLKAFQSFLEPSDKTPNVLDMGSSKVIAAFMADKLTDAAKNVNVSQDGFEFDIPDTYLFEKGTATPNKKYLEVVNRLIQVTSGLEDSQIKITSSLFVQAVKDQSEPLANQVASDRIEVLSNKIKATFEHDTNEIKGSTNVKNKKGEYDQEKLIGMIRISIKQKANPSKPQRKIETLFGDKDSAKDVYDNFASQVSNRKGKADEKVKVGLDTSLVNPADAESKNVEAETDPTFTEDNSKSVNQ